MLVERAAELALAGQKQALLLHSEVNNRAQVNLAKDKLAEIGKQADDLATEAEAREAKE